VRFAALAARRGEGEGAYHSREVRFEVVSANVARALVIDHWMSGRRADTVWDVAALHGG